jgi:arylsulfate sulfotransferase
MQSRITFLCAVSLLTVFAGCSSGGSPSNSAATSESGDFTLAIAPSTVTINPGGPAQTITVTASPVNGFAGNVSVAVGALPSGVTATPMTLSMAPGGLQQISVAATPAAAAGSATISLQATSGSLSHSITTALTVGPAIPPVSTNAALSGSSFSFGNNLVNNTITQSVVTVTNTGTTALTMNPALSGDPSYALVSTGSCGAQLAAAASCAVMVSYKPATASAPAAQNASLDLGFVGVPAGTPQTVALSGTSAALPVGQVVSTNNPQVALYTLTLPFPGSVTVSFGKDTTYGTKTWTQSTPEGGLVSIFVAGMQGSTTYHMQASVQFTNGISSSDIDHTFTTQAVPATMQPKLTATTAAGMTPQPGVEVLNLLSGTPSGVVVTDLTGNVLWTYAVPGIATNTIQGVKLLSNGDFLMAIGPSSSSPITGGVPPGSISEIREVNLEGDTVREITVNDLNGLLATASCAECKVTLETFHHDIEPLPNGHWLVLANTSMQLSATTTPSLNNAPPTTVLGDVVVDLDENLKPVWAWNVFNHLNPSHHPYMFPDWTHSNAVLYSPGDGNIMISMRHENWVIKVDYEDGKGSGAVIWRLGEGGNFTLKNGVDPTDWQYAQHYPSFFSASTSGVFSLGMMDNGDDRIFAGGITCGAPGNPPCLYSTIPVFQIDENAMTATLTSHQILPTSLYNLYGGSADVLPNANIEYDLCGVGGIGEYSYVYEVTPQSTPQTVWTMQITGTNAYRGIRMPSLYPGVQW